ncbi:Histone deacetylase complex subunit SAP130 [Amphibalanus amphitrite]|uniref:Histone deacetylase complex subunit SAP130 n=1 Tax=Amphibalanus amphitrite TaxID=1232801 RepID=A0A6A4XAG3_AMPAM|nr:Histone deacetylase complex subunit SAP130 [Amphibalanus amphitrite]
MAPIHAHSVLQQPPGGAPMGGGGGKQGSGPSQQHHHGAINLTKSEESAPPATTPTGAGQKPEAVAVLGHQGLLTVSRSAVGVQGSGGTIALMTPVMSRAGSTQSGTHLQPTAYHLARGTGSAGSSPRVIGPQAVRVGHLPISSIVGTGAHSVSYQVSHRAMTPTSLPAGLVVPVTSIGGAQPVLLRAAPAAPSQAGGATKTAAKAAKLSTVTMSAGGAVRAAGPARVTVGHTGSGARTVSPQARLVSPSGGAAPRPLHITHIAAEKVPRALAGAATTLRQSGPITYSMLPAGRGQQQVIRGPVHLSVPAPPGGFSVSASSSGDRGEALPLTVKAGPAPSGAATKAGGGHQITMTVPWPAPGQQGAKVITQPAHGPPLQLSQFVPTQGGQVRAATSQATAASAAPAASSAGAPAVAAAAVVQTSSTAIPVAKHPQQQQQPATSRDQTLQPQQLRHPGEPPAAVLRATAAQYGVPAGVVFEHAGYAAVRQPTPEPAGQEGADEPTPSTSAGAGAASSAGAAAGAGAGASGPVPGTGTPPLGLSPRKKPRKQNLASTVSAAPAASFPAVPFSRPRPARPGSDDEMNFLRERMRTPASSSAASTAAAVAPRPAEPAPPPPKRPAMSLLNSYGPRTWKPASSHFVKYTDVRGRDERRPTIADLASQKHISQKVNGWKIHHISEMLRASERMSFSRREDKEITKLNELIKRSKILRDQLSEAKVQITSVFEHKEAIEQAIERYGRKRPTRKRDRR